MDESPLALRPAARYDCHREANLSQSHFEPSSRTFRPPVGAVRTRRILGTVLGLVLLLPTTITWMLAFAPATITIDVDDGHLHIRAGIGFLASERDVPLERIRDVRPVSLGRGGRKMGTAMAGHCSGTWSYRDLGEVWQATDCRRDALLVETDEQRLVLSAEDTDGLRRSLTARKVWHSGESAGMPRWIRALLALGGFAALGSGVLLVALAIRGPESMIYTVNAEGLTVRTLLRQRTLPLLGATVKRTPKGPSLRVAGTALPGYFTGWFLMDGRRVRVWATMRENGVLVEGAERWYVTPKDVEGFLAAAREAGATNT